MTRLLRLLTGLLVVLVLVVGSQAALDASSRGQAEPSVVTPTQQLPPSAIPLPDVLAPLSPSAPAPDPAVLGPLLEAALRFQGPGAFAGTVVDSSDGTVLFSRDAARLQAPASNIKLFTAVAAMTYAEPGERLTTSVLASATRPGALYLHGGGDVLLGAGPSDPDAVVGHAGLGTLAARTADALDPGSGPYTVYLDDGLFTGPALNPTWARGDIEAGQIAPVHALAVNSAWLGEGRTSGLRSQDAALDAARTFAAALSIAAAERGTTVSVGVERAGTPEGARAVAAVESAPLEDQVHRMLEASDNYLAEALARTAALGSGRPASFDGATRTLAAAAERLGVPGEGMVLGDAAGLSVRNAVSPVQLAVLLRATTTSGVPGLVAVARSLPVAGATGTLSGRFDPEDGHSAAGAGVVRAKTGTLDAVTALSGHVVTVDGRLLVFSFLAAGLDGNTAQARDAADAAAAVLASCGCR